MQMMPISQFVTDYGYFAVFIGCVLEGETVLLLGGFAACQGYLSYPLVVAAAFCGGALGDQLCFFLGRYFGEPFLSHWPRLMLHIRPVQQLIQRYNTGLIVGVRFMYGFRIAGPVAIGMSSVPATRFVLFNFLGAILWAMLIASAGCLFGKSLQMLSSHVYGFEFAVVLLVISVVVISLLFRKWRSQQKR